MSKVVIHIFHDDPSSLANGSHVAERVRQVQAERKVALEVYVFGPAEKALTRPDCQDYNGQIDSLARNGVPVGTCISIAESLDAKEAFKTRGLRLEYARDAFARFALEGATVISF
jgi:hypothetical protein